MKAAFRQSTLKVASFARDAAALIQDEYKLTFEDNCCRILHVRPQLRAAEFPRNTHDRDMLAKRLSRDHGENYLLVNLSGRTYDTTTFQGPVLDVLMCGAVAPIEVILRLCVSAHAWLSRSTARRLVAHGGAGSAVNPLPWSRSTAADAALAFGPVVTFFACYLSWAGIAANPFEAMVEICEALRVPEDAIAPSQRRYLRTFELLQRGLLETSSAPRYLLLQVALVGMGGDGESRLLRVWHQDRVLLQAEVPIADECDSSVVQVPASERQICRGDICVQVLRFAKGEEPVGGKAFLEFQVCFHSASTAADGVLRFQGRQLDAYGGGPVDDCIVDVFLELDGSDAAGASMDGTQEALAAAPPPMEAADEREAVASAVAAAAAQSGPRCSLALDDEEELWSAAELPASAPRFMGSPCASGSPATAVAASCSSQRQAHVYDIGADDESPTGGGKKFVFSPDGIDSFFDDLG